MEEKSGLETVNDQTTLTVDLPEYKQIERKILTEGGELYYGNSKQGQ